MSLVFRLMARGVADLGKNPLAQAFTLASVSLVAFLAGLTLLAVTTVDREIASSRGQIEFQAYLTRQMSPEAVAKAMRELAALPGVLDMKTFSPEEALDSLGRGLGDASLVEPFKGKSPLPATALIVLKVPDNPAPGWASEVVLRAKAIQGVDSVRYNPLQAELAGSWLGFSRSMAWPLIGFLMLVSSVIIAGTIKLSQISRREEIEILRLVGASAFYVRLPLLTGGAALGLTGGLISLGLLKMAQLGLKELVAGPPLFVSLDFLPLDHAGLFLGGLVLVSLLASFVAIRDEA